MIGTRVPKKGKGMRTSYGSPMISIAMPTDATAAVSLRENREDACGSTGKIQQEDT